MPSIGAIDTCRLVKGGRDLFQGGQEDQHGRTKLPYGQDDQHPDRGLGVAKPCKAGLNANGV